MKRWKKPRRSRAPRRHAVEQLETRSLMATLTGTPPLPAPPPVASIDGTGHNLQNPSWGSVGVDLLRIAPAKYADGIASPAGADRPSARTISNAVAAESTETLNNRHMSAMVYAFGQFLDHDIDLTLSATPSEAFNISVPTGDPQFDPNGTGTQVIPLNRSNWDAATGTSAANPRQQVNSITAFVDGSQVYGSDTATATALRTLSGGKLKTSDGNLLPRDAAGFFQAGDIRANENLELLSFHTLFVREHNRLADQIAKANPSLTDEQIYQRARTIVMGELQAITYNEFLPALLGPNAIRPYAGYNSKVNPGIANEFSTAAFRVGHTMLGDDTEFLDNNGNEVREPLALRDAFFNPAELLPTGPGPILKYLATDNAREIDTKIVDDVRNFLFGPPGSGGLDLASLNIQRGRDHGLADFNTTRAAYGLPKVQSFAEITSDPALQSQLQSLYGTVDKIDLWVGGLAEDHVPGASVGPTFQRIIADQFMRLRDGDRFFYLNTLKGDQLQQVDKTTLASVIRNNTEITNLQRNVFFDPSVLLFQQPGPLPMNVAVVAGTGTVDVVQPGTPPKVLASRPVGEVAQVSVLGAAARADTLMVDYSKGDLPMPDGVVFNGGDGPGDKLLVRATAGVDTISVSRDRLTVNGRSVQMAGVEELQIETGPGNDLVTIGKDVRIKVLVDGKLPPPPTAAASSGATGSTATTSRTSGTSNVPPPVGTPAANGTSGANGGSTSGTTTSPPRRRPLPPDTVNAIDTLFRQFGEQ